MMVCHRLFIAFLVFRKSENYEKPCFFMLLRVWGVHGGFPEFRGIILTTTRLDMMVSGFIFDVFLMIEVWKSDVFTD